MFIFFLFTSGVFWKSIHFEVASDSFSLLINSSWLLVFAIILFVLIFPYIFYLVSLITPCPVFKEDKRESVSLVNPIHHQSTVNGG